MEYRDTIGMLSGPSAYYIKDDQSIDSQALFSCTLLLEPNRAFAAELLAALDGQVGELVYAQSVAEALELLGSTFVELVIFDAELPELGGIHMLEALRQVRPGLPLIGLVSAANSAVLVSLLRAGAWDCQLKNSGPSLPAEIHQVIQKVSERKLREMQQAGLQAERNVFYLAAMTSQDGLAVMSSLGTSVFVNRAFEHFCITLGQAYIPGEPLNVTALIGQHDQNLARQLKKTLSANTAEQALWRAELSVALQEGGEDAQRFFQLTSTAVAIGVSGRMTFDSPGELRQQLLWVRDITQEKNRQRLQKELLAATTHDLKGPLGVIRLASEMLRSSDTISNQQSTELVERIYSSAEKSLAHLDQVLKLRKMEDGFALMQPVWLKADSLIKDWQSEYRNLAAASKHQLTAEPVAEDLMIYADAVALQRVMANLITNAIKYTPAGGEIRISAAADGRMLRLTVADNGSGIEAAERHKLFERYGRLKEHVGIEGTGLGLYIANNIVKAHGGNIEVHSQLGVGTAFVVCLPLPAEHCSALIAPAGGNGAQSDADSDMQKYVAK